MAGSGWTSVVRGEAFGRRGCADSGLSPPLLETGRFKPKRPLRACRAGDRRHQTRYAIADWQKTPIAWRPKTDLRRQGGRYGLSNTPTTPLDSDQRDEAEHRSEYQVIAWRQRIAGLGNQPSRDQRRKTTEDRHRRAEAQ